MAASLRLPYVSITAQQNGALVTMASYGELKGPVEILPLIAHYQQVGQFVVGRRENHQPLPRADKATLNRVAQQISELLYTLRLHADLQLARERLVLAREEERRRLRRDLHDGLGPALAGLPLKVDAAIDLVEQDRCTSVRLLAEVKKQAQQLVGEVRRVVHDLRPPALDELGLPEALRGALAQLSTPLSRLTIGLETGELPRELSAAIEVAAYRITMEAVTNVIKHAQARHCQVSLEVIGSPCRLCIAIVDDGVGLPETVAPSVGLHSMRERAEELGGMFQIQPRPGGGTSIMVTLPLPEGSTS